MADAVAVPVDVAVADGVAEVLADGVAETLADAEAVGLGVAASSAGTEHVVVVDASAAPKLLHAVS